MAYFIDKAALVAEIERLSAYLDSLSEQRIIEKILSIIDTLEVEEVDLEKEYERYYEQERNIQTFKLAKHFFELGIKVQKGE